MEPAIEACYCVIVFHHSRNRCPVFDQLLPFRLDACAPRVPGPSHGAFHVIASSNLFEDVLPEAVYSSADVLQDVEHIQLDISIREGGLDALQQATACVADGNFQVQALILQRFHGKLPGLARAVIHGLHQVNVIRVKIDARKHRVLAVIEDFIIGSLGDAVQGNGLGDLFRKSPCPVQERADVAKGWRSTVNALQNPLDSFHRGMCIQGQ